MKSIVISIRQGSLTETTSGYNHCQRGKYTSRLQTEEEAAVAMEAFRSLKVWSKQVSYLYPIVQTVFRVHYTN